jgi:hypothetical protein
MKWAHVRDIDVPGAGRVHVTVYHLCPTFACGSTLGPAVIGRWWAERQGTGWSFFWDTDLLSPRAGLGAALEWLLRELAPSPADLARKAQDDRYEGPDV